METVRAHLFLLGGNEKYLELSKRVKSYTWHTKSMIYLYLLNKRNQNKPFQKEKLS